MGGKGRENSGNEGLECKSNAEGLINDWLNVNRIGRSNSTAADYRRSSASNLNSTPKPKAEMMDGLIGFIRTLSYCEDAPLWGIQYNDFKNNLQTPGSKPTVNDDTVMKTVFKTLYRLRQVVESSDYAWDLINSSTANNVDSKPLPYPFLRDKNPTVETEGAHPASRSKRLFSGDTDNGKESNALSEVSADIKEEGVFFWNRERGPGATNENSEDGELNYKPCAIVKQSVNAQKQAQEIAKGQEA